MNRHYLKELVHTTKKSNSELKSKIIGVFRSKASKEFTKISKNNLNNSELPSIIELVPLNSSNSPYIKNINYY